jgi:DsbC/DsbD-like thiol-disulfide interchange protein
MKKLLVLVLILMLNLSTKAQIETPIRWAQGAKRINTTQMMVLLRARMQPGWHIYSQKINKGGPINTSFRFKASKDYDLAGKTIEPTAKSKYEKSFKMNIGYFEKEVIFQQRVKLKTATATELNGSLEYAICNSTGCLPPESLAFNIPLK